MSLLFLFLSLLKKKKNFVLASNSLSIMKWRSENELISHEIVKHSKRLAMHGNMKANSYGLYGSWPIS